MIVPEKGFDYSSVFEFQITSTIDGSIIKGIYQENSLRSLSEGEGGESEKKSFTWYVESHDDQGIVMQMIFDDPKTVSTSSYGQDGFGLKIKEYTIFDSAVQDSVMDETGVPKTVCGDTVASFCKLMPPIIES
jgi:hypothetical protein